MIENTITTNENLVQDNSSIEYVSPETNPIAPVQSNELIFGQKHKDIDCALCPTAKRACDRAWVTAKQIENWSKMSTKTLNRRLHELEECERISRLSDLTNVDIPTETGAVKTTLYNLNVLNQLAMIEMKNKVLNETAKKFSDILSEVETTGSYSIRKPDSYSVNQTQPMMLPDFCNPAEAARAWADLYEKNQATELRALTAETAHAETKALLAEEKEKVDNLTRTKSWINDKKTATAMGTASAKSKECERLKKEVCELKSEMDLQIYNAREAIRKEYEETWMTARDWCYNHKLTVKINEPKWAVSDKLTEICESYPYRKPQWCRDSRGTKLFPKWARDILDKVYEDDSTFLSEYRIV